MHYEEPLHFVPTVKAATHDVLVKKPLNILLQAGRFFTFPKRRQGSLAEATGVPCMIGCICESEIGVIAAVHLAAATQNFHYAGLDSGLLLKEETAEDSQKAKKLRPLSKLSELGAKEID